MLENDINAFNFTSQNNGVTIKYCSSSTDKCVCNNILINERKVK